MQFQAQIEVELRSTQTGPMVMATYAQLTDGRVDTDTVVPLIAAVVNRGERRGSDRPGRRLELAVQIEEAVGSPPGADHRCHSDRRLGAAR